MTFAFTLLAVASLVAIICVLGAARDEDSLQPFDDYARSAGGNPLFAVVRDRLAPASSPDLPADPISGADSTWR